jgi:hypothetical protein
MAVELPEKLCRLVGRGTVYKSADASRFRWSVILSTNLAATLLKKMIIEFA